jgi:uncharacterized membrane protein YqiK
MGSNINVRTNMDTLLIDLWNAHPRLVVFLGLVILAAAYRPILWFFGIVMVADDSIGVVTKKFALGKQLPDGSIIALNGEAGFQADTLTPGLHFRLWPLQYRVELVKFLTVPPGKVGCVEACDGRSLATGRVIARTVACDSFQDARSFLTKGGERGPQMALIGPGTYRINPLLFRVELANVIDIPDNKVGVVTTREGCPLAKGEIAGLTVEGHNLFQDPQTFLDNHGTKGLQEQVLLSGRYFINPRFATIEVVDMFEVPIAHVGVVIAFVGKEGKDVTGDQFRHGNLVSKGEKGVWIEPLDPGKYPINPYTHKVCNVPTANVVLNWATGKTEAHKLDANLSTITVRSADGFKFNLDVSQIIHIPRNDAPKVIARFGGMSALVTQVLEPTIGNYFRNAAQGSDIIDFLKNRSARQEEARRAISGALKEYNVGAVDTLIGDIVPPDQLMKTLTDRKIAEQERVTYETQRQAQEVKQQLEQATALAATQAKVVDAERQVAIAQFNAEAGVRSAEGLGRAKKINAEADAQAKKINAEADATVLRSVGDAEAAKTNAVGSAEAAVIKLKIASMESGNYAMVQVAEALAKSGVKLVPDIVAGGGNAGGTLVDVLLANMIRDGHPQRVLTQAQS